VAEFVYLNAPKISIMADWVWRSLDHQSEIFKLSVGSALFSWSDDSYNATTLMPSKTAFTTKQVRGGGGKLLLYKDHNVFLFRSSISLCHSEGLSYRWNI